MTNQNENKKMYQFTRPFGGYVRGEDFYTVLATSEAEALALIEDDPSAYHEDRIIMRDDTKRDPDGEGFTSNGVIVDEPDGSVMIVLPSAVEIDLATPPDKVCGGNCDSCKCDKN